MSTARSTARVLLLDLDGTLVDSAADLATALNRLLGEAGAEPLPLAAVRSMVGDGARKLVERGLAAAALTLDPEPATTRFLALYGEALTRETRPYPGVAETLAALRQEGWRPALCTNKPEAPSRAILEGLGLSGLFEAVAGGDSFATRKPDPAPLLALLERLGGAPATAVMVGDGPNDLQAAAAAGLQAVWARYGYGGPGVGSLPHAAAIERFEALPAVLRRLSGAAAGG